MTEPWAELSPRVVMVARYDERDGIGRYAEQLIAARRSGRAFVRVGIPEGPGDYPRAFHRGPRWLWLLRDARRGDDVVVHYHPHYYVRGGTLARIGTQASFGLLALLRRTIVVVHEPDERGSRLEEAVAGWAWRRQPVVVFHSAWERQRHLGRFGSGRRQRLAVVEHGDFFATSIRAERAEARVRLGLPAERTLLLIIGWLSPGLPDKGYDRAIAAVRECDDPDVELHIVGSPIREGPEVDALLHELRSAADESDRVVLHEQYVDDETFDLWLRAADAVLTPYRSASSSGVIARAHLLGTPVVTSDAGGLAEQAGPGDTVVRDDAALVEAVRRVAQERRASSSR